MDKNKTPNQGIKDILKEINELNSEIYSLKEKYSTSIGDEKGLIKDMLYEKIFNVYSGTIEMYKIANKIPHTKEIITILDSIKKDSKIVANLLKNLDNYFP
jgi:hypothetical protein